MAHPVEDMDWQGGDCSTYYQLPILYMFRNDCAPAIAEIIVRDFRFISYLQPKNNVEETLTIHEFLRRVHNKGKKTLEKGRKQCRDEENVCDTNFKTMQINNLKDYKDNLEDYTVGDLLTDREDSHFKVIQCFRTFDVTFLLNVVTNKLLGYDLKEDLAEAIHSMKSIRNAVFHCGQKVECSEFQSKFKELYSKLKVMYNYLHWDCSKLEERKAAAENLLYNKAIGDEIFGEIRREMFQQPENKSKPDSYFAPHLTDTSTDRPIENLEQFVGECKQPIVLCGSSGAGKSTELKNLRYKFYVGEHNMRYKLVIFLDSSDRVISHCNFSEIVDSLQTNIIRNCPVIVEKYGIDLCYWAVNLHADDILFLVNWNVKSFKEERVDFFGGHWIFCTQGSNCDCFASFCIVRIEPLDDVLVKQMLRFLITNQDRCHKVISLYEKCDYKSLISTPDMVTVFKDIEKPTSITHLLSSYMERRQISPENRLILGEISFSHILHNNSEYSDLELNDVSDDLKFALLETNKNSKHTFRLRVLEDFLAAEYVTTYPQKACEKWIRQVPLFKRVFRYVCVLWHEHGELAKNLHYLKSYLMKFIDIKSSRNKKENTSRSSSDRSDVNQFNQGAFTKWPHLINIAEECQFQSDFMELLCNLLAQKTLWVFKCKIFDDDKLEMLKRLLQGIRLAKEQSLVIRLDSGVQKDILCNIWNVITNIEGLFGQTSVHINVMHRQIPVPSDSKISQLPAAIINVSHDIFITKYKGPFLCTEIPEFFRCNCMRKLEVFDVTVYDLISLAQALSCEMLNSLQTLVINVNLRMADTDLIRLQNLRLPSLQYPLILSIKYFDKLQDLLNRFENKEQLKTLTIYGVRITKNFRFNMAEFTGLEALFIHFNPYVTQFGRKARLEVKKSPEFEQPMDCDEPQIQDQNVFRPFNLVFECQLPKNCKRLLLRNAEFWNDSDTYIMLTILEKNDLQRLTVLDSNISVRGVRSILKRHVEDKSDVENSLSRDFKKHRISRPDSNIIHGIKQKNPRLCQEEREKRRKCKPDGKELIITSQLKMCSNCEKFPCECSGEDRDSLEDVIYLIEDAYCYEILALNYSSEFISVRKDVCGDLRIKCPLTGLTDDAISNIGKDYGLKLFFYSLTLAQNIELNCTNVSLSGAEKVIKLIIQFKSEVCTVQEPFTLSLSSFSYPLPEELKYSTFLQFLIDESNLRQFKFSNAANKNSYIKKTLDNMIFMDDEFVRDCR